MGVKVEQEEEGLRVTGTDNLLATSIQTGPYPELDTDFMPLLMSLMCVANGKSTITETIFENRF